MTMYGFIFSLLFMTSLHAAQYRLADLEVLTQEENYEEFFSHALDILPSERQESWKGMLSKMADGFTRQILSKSSISQGHFKKIESLFTWPALKADDIFKGQRNEIGLRYLKNCLKQEKPCWDELKDFWEADQKDPDNAFKLAELTLHFDQKPISTWTFMEGALKSPLSEFYCKKDFVVEAVWQKLAIDYIRLGEKGDFLKKIDETVHPDCLPSLNQVAKGQLLNPNTISDRELAYQLLNAQGKMRPELSDFFLTVYLLENPSKGELFNLAWNRLSELSRSISRREVVLKNISRLDPLPDELFSSLDQNKKRAILNLFKVKFPEYLHLYTTQCLKFYEGKTIFSHGNPTIKCQDLMRLDFAQDVLGQETIDRFYKIKSI
jgi:hypothetical protein